ncbi:MAG: carbon-nitrogen hydrolase family protein [Lachnospiraceae bacterium]|nr:carbon-nitrogen hydrolase family protein [Lachnospiraceae bacterium]
MRILGIQPGTVQPGMDDYFERQLALAEQAYKGQELIMFPELMTGIYFGYVREKRWFEKAERFIDGPTTKRMLELSKKLGTHICYSLFEKAPDGFYNTMGLVTPIRGVIGKYRKIHIPGGDLRYNECYEKYYFKSGDLMPVFELDNGIKMAMMLCYDRSFPEQWRAYYLKGAQVVCVAACTMGLRADMFTAELQTRALESHTYVIALNRAGEEKTENEEKPRVHFGKSLVADPMGNIVTQLADEQWAVLEAEVDTEKIRYARGRLNWERDRHPELYGILADTDYAMKGMVYERGYDDQDLGDE